MKVVILAGGHGTRISEETGILPKAMVEIGGRPILWHIMKLYAFHGLTEFVICCGYKGNVIKRYFLDFFNDSSDITVDVERNTINVHRSATEPWRVTLIDTGPSAMTGGRLKRVQQHLNETFCLTYGDGVSDIDISSLVTFHRKQAVLATVTSVAQPGRYGALDLSLDRPRVRGFREKSAADGHFINGGFFVVEPQVLDYIEGDDTVWEEGPLRQLVKDDQLAVYRHEGYWQNMDTLRDKQFLQREWETGKAGWCVWESPNPAS